MDSRMAITMTRRQGWRSSLQRAGTWAKLIAITGFAQVAVQAIGFISGILVIRLLPTHEYALYTLANTMLGTMTLLADGGIATGVMSQGGKVWQDKQKLGAVLVTGMQLRKKFAVFSLLVATPILFYLLRKHDASWLMSSLIVLSLIPAFFTSLSGTLLEIAPKLHQDIAPLQKNQVASNVLRLALLGLTLFVYPFAAVAVACSGGSQIWSNWRLRKISNRYADRSQLVDPEVSFKLIGIVKRTMPGSIYYCISGQITVWLISIFGTTEALAQIGALGRLTMLLNIFSVLFQSLLIPRYARLPKIRKILIVRFMQLQSFLVLFIILIMGTIWLFPFHVLSLLGKNYMGLTNELVLMVFGSCMGLLGGAVYSLNAVRNHIFPPAILYPVLIAAQVFFLLIFHVNTVLMAAVYSISMQSLAYLLLLAYGLYSLAKVNKGEFV